MAYSFAYTRIKDTRTDPDSPITEALMQDLTSNDAFNNGLIRSNGTALYTGTVDSDPTSAATSKAIDAGPSGGAIGNVLSGMIYEVTSGNALGVMGTINAIVAGSNRVSVNTNLYSQGMRSGDSYRVIYGNATDLAHKHTGTDGPLIPQSSIDGGIAPDMRQSVDEGDDFTTVRTTASPFNTDRFRYVNSGGDRTAALAAVAGLVGAIKLSGASPCGFITESLPYYMTKTNARLRVRAAATAGGGANEQTYVGLAVSQVTDLYGGANADGVFLLFRRAASVNSLIAVARVGSVDTELSLATAWTDGTYYDVEFRRTAATVITVYLNGTSIGTITSTITTVALGFGASIQSSSGTTEFVTIDYWQYTATR